MFNFDIFSRSIGVVRAQFEYGYNCSLQVFYKYFFHVKCGGCMTGGAVGCFFDLCKEP